MSTSSILSNDQAEMLRIHKRCIHTLSIAYIKFLSASVKFTSLLSKCTRPICATCCCGLAQRKTWKSKGKNNKGTLHQLTHLLGETSHDEIMTNSVLDLVPQMVGFLGSKKFHYTSFFFDDRSDYTFVHHQFSTPVEETMKAKYACECDTRKHSKEVRHCHVDDSTCAAASHKKEINDNK